MEILEAPTCFLPAINLPSKPGVYFLQAENGLIKIGHSFNMLERFEDINKVSPINIQAVGCFLQKTKSESEVLEKSFHKDFNDLWVRGEWFKPGERLLDLIRNEAQRFVRKKTYSLRNKTIVKEIMEVEGGEAPLSSLARLPLFKHAQVVRLSRLLEMLYKPAELAEEIEVNPDTVYRSYIPAGCPHEVDGRGRIWINGKEFIEWVKGIREFRKQRNRNPLQAGEGYCFRCKKNMPMSNLREVYSNLKIVMMQGECGSCGGKVNRGYSKKALLTEE